MRMNSKDKEYRECSYWLDKVILLRSKGPQHEEEAANCMQKAMAIYDEHFGEKKKVLTEDLCPF